MPLNYTCNPVSNQCYSRTSSYQYTVHLSVELWSNWSLYKRLNNLHCLFHPSINNNYRLLCVVRREHMKREHMKREHMKRERRTQQDRREH
ncbi:hypothetical protein Pmani_026818 [Petrolisthes manimaculis]|uniref:Uncharacterized protein n=1 Tax=Petrolisthes manimaculis TaxID=1843537 RepID=A0AAE1P597_9EUCA|nr:hypothetical protein Pmani_026818 [Petrolisthes manimaculis]